MKQQFTSVMEKHGKWYVAYINEIPGVNTQGRTRKSARRNLKEALALIIRANRELRGKNNGGKRLRSVTAQAQVSS
jgi:predicted RNase H-like HicB family nuclease